MNNTKKIILEQDIDSARCRGHWVLVKLLAAKYRDRYVENSALGALILGEATLNTTLSSNPKRCFDIVDSSSNLRKNVSLIYAKNEALNNAQQESLKEATNFLENAAAKFKDLNRHFYMQCNILLAKIYLETGRFQLAIEQLQDLDYQVPLEEIVEDVGQYGKAIMLMGSVIKGLAYLLLGQEEVAFEIISIAASMAHLQFTKTLPTEYPNIKSSLFTQHPKSNQNQWGHWLEYLLFLHIILGFKLGHGAVDSVLLSLNTYLDNIREISHEGFVAVPISSHDSSFSQSTLFFSNDTRKIPILQLYITKLLEKTNDFSLSFSNIPIIPMNKTYLKPEIYIEIMKYIPIFEVLVTSVIQFPQGEDKSYLGSERLSRVKRCYDIWAILLINKPADEIFQAYVDRHYKLIEACYRGTKHTFHSLKLLRYLAHTFASLLKINHDDMPTEEKREAEKVVDSYVFLLNKHLTELIEQAQKKKLEEKVVEYRKRRSTLISANPNTPLEPITPKFLANPKVVISSVDGESIADAIGVYFSGIRILLLNVEGEEDKLRTALTYAQNALTLFNDHGVSILESENVSTKKPRKALYDFIKQKIYQYLGITYGELALEVRDSDLRQEFQKEAVKALNIAAELASEENSWDLLYQLSLQLAEVGEIEKAIVTINKSLALNASHSSSWNLLALCLSSKKEYSQAIKVCDAGFKEAISRLTRKNTLDPNRGSFSWDDVEDSIKEDLINLKMTEMVIDVGLNGPNSGLTNLQEIFKWYRKFFNVGSIGSLGRSEPKHRMAVSVTSPSCASIPLRYRFRVYDLFVSLWLAASSLYRTIGEFEVAYSCISEADTVASNIVRSDDFQRKKSPRLFDPDQGTNKKNPSSEFDIRLTKKWGLEVPFVRRVLSDILFEAAMIKHAEYNAQILRNTNSFTFSPADTKYLSPVVQAEADYKAKKQANMSNRAGGFYKRGNMSNISVATTNSAGGYFSANLSPSNNINHINLLMVKSYSQASLTEPTSNGERLRPDVTLDSLTAEFLFISQLDDDHIPTRVHLGLLALERGDAYLAENLLERAMKRGKARGCSGGKSGIASYYGGITGVWGWEAWKALGKVMNKTKRMNEARECFSFAVDIEKASPVRGFECLSRLVKGKEW